MQRHEMIDAMRGLGLKGMAGAFDEAVTTGVQRKRTAMEILSDLLRAEGAHRHAASIRYRMTAARLPVVKDLDAFVFENTPINEGLVRSLHAGSFRLRVPRFLIRVEGEYPAFIRRRSWPLRQHIRLASASQEMCEDGSRYNPSARRRSWPGRPPATKTNAC